MKKLIAALMSICLIFCCAVSFAGEAAATTISWSDYEAEAAKVEGQFANVADIGLRMFIPAEFKDTEIPKDAQEGGTFLVLKSDKEEKAVVNAQFLNTDIDTFKAAIEAQGITTYETEVNGLQCLQFMVHAGDVATASFAFHSDNGSVVVFSFTPANQEPYTGLYKLMAASLQSAE